MVISLDKVPNIICFFFGHNWFSPEWISKCSIENPTSEKRQMCRRCGKVEALPVRPTPKEEIQAILNGEDEETELDELILDEDDNVIPEYAAALQELGVKVKFLSSTGDFQSVGDDGISRTGPGASRLYD